MNHHTSEATGSQIPCKHIWDQDTLLTQYDDTTMNMMLPFDEISLNRLESSDGCDGF